MEGYEIHMGITKNLGGCQPMIFLEDGRTDGLAREDFSVFGSYLHGLFDDPAIAGALTRRLMEAKGIAAGVLVDEETYKNQQYDRLADLLRKSLDMEKVYEILEKGVGDE